MLLAFSALVSGLYKYVRKDPARHAWTVLVPPCLLCVCVMTFRSARKVVITSVSQLESGVPLAGSV